MSSFWQQWHDPERKIRLGVSSCLLGERVRYDGKDKRDPYIVDVLGPWVEWTSVCPEAEIGLGVPRPTIQLEEGGSRPRLIEPSSGRDLTERMESYSMHRLQELNTLEIDGYIFKNSSPSCGPDRVRVWGGGGLAVKNGRGVFARLFQEKMPCLPVEEEMRLNDHLIRGHFIEHIFCRNRWSSITKGEFNRDALIEFHSSHELLLRSHNEVAWRRLGRIVRGDVNNDLDQLVHTYEEELYRALSSPATIKRHVKVLGIVVRRIENGLPDATIEELRASIENFRRGLVPQIVPITLLLHHAVLNGNTGLQRQMYLDPHPGETMLRYRV